MTMIFSRINSSHDLPLSSKIRNKYLEKQKVKQKVQLKVQQTAHNTRYIIYVVRNTFDDTRLKLAKNQAKANQHLELNFLLSGNYLPRYHPKKYNILTKCAKTSVSVLIELYV